MLMLWLFHIICPDVSLEHRPLMTSVRWPCSSPTCLLPTSIGLPCSTFHYSLPSLPCCCVPVVFTVVPAFALLCCFWLSDGHGISYGISFLDHSSSEVFPPLPISVSVISSPALLCAIFFAYSYVGRPAAFGTVPWWFSMFPSHVTVTIWHRNYILECCYAWKGLFYFPLLCNIRNTVEF